MVPDDADCWVIAYKDKGPIGFAPGGGWPTKIAHLFDTEEDARDWWEENKGILGRQPEVDIYPVRDHRSNRTPLCIVCLQETGTKFDICIDCKNLL